MKTFSLLLASLFAGTLSAQEVEVKKIDASQEGSTTIEIKKGSKEAPAGAKWMVQDGEADVEGASGATTKDAKAEWTKACADWKKEMREDNKENKILNLNCGKATCGGDAGNKVCASKATYKIKTKAE